MARAVIMPRQGQSVESCIITRFLKKPGDPVKAGEILFTYETDKATFEEECPADGVLLAVFFEEGDDVPCLTNVCVIGEAGENVEAFAPKAAGGAGAGASGGAIPGASGPASPGVSGVASPGSPSSGSPLSSVAPPAPATAPGASFPAASADHLTASASPATNAGANNLSPSASPAAEADAHPGAAAAPRVSPRARAMAKRLGVTAAQATGTGPRGRVIARDIGALVAAGRMRTPAAAALDGEPLPFGSGIGGRTIVDDLRAAMQKAVSSASESTGLTDWQLIGVHPFVSNGYRDEPMSGVRKSIGRAMRASLGDMAQLTHTASFDATELLALRRRMKEQGEALGLAGVTIGDIVLFAVARTLPAFPALNAHRIGDSMRFFQEVNLGVAVDTPRGLLVPTVSFANRLSLKALSDKVKELSAQCHSGSISPDLLKNGTFTVSNLGSFGIEHFTPVINPPQTGILGVNTITERPRTGKSGIELYPCMTLSLTYDHCALDGAPASRFLQALCGNLERITLLLAM